MKILFFQNKPNVTEGIISNEVHVTEVFNHLSKQGHTVIYINGNCHNQNNNAQISSKGNILYKTILIRAMALIFRIPLIGSEAYLFWSLLLEFKRLILASRTIFRYKPDLIYRSRGFPIIWGAELLLSKIYNIPCIEEINGIAVDEAKISRNFNWLTLKLIGAIEKRYLSQADKYIVVTSKLKDTLCKDFHIPKRRISIVENGVNIELFTPKYTIKKQLETILNKNQVCFVGVFYPWQGVEYLIEAMPIILKQYPDAKTLLVGDGPMKNKLVELVNRLGLSNSVVFTGRVRYEQVPMYINAGTVCVAPFVKERNERIGLSPLKLCEYLSCEKPVVASRISGLEVLEEYNCGYLVEPEDSEQLAQAIMRLLDDPNLRAQMGKNGRRYVLENRGWESVAKKVVAVCEEAIREY